MRLSVETDFFGEILGPSLSKKFRNYVFSHYKSSYFSENGDVFSVTPSTLFELCDILKIYFIFKQWMLFLWLYVCFRSGIRNTLTLENMLAKRRLSLCEFRRISSAVPCVFMRQTDNLDCNEYSLILAETLISIHNRHVYSQYRSIVSVVIHILAMFCRDWRIDSSSLQAVAAQSEATTDLLHAIRKFARNWLYCRPAEHLLANTENLAFRSDCYCHIIGIVVWFWSCLLLHFIFRWTIIMILIVRWLLLLFDNVACVFCNCLFGSLLELSSDNKQFRIDVI